MKCYQDKVYEGNLRASVAVLKKLSDQWKEYAAKISPLDPMRETLKSFRHKVSLSLSLSEFGYIYFCPVTRQLFSVLLHHHRCCYGFCYLNKLLVDLTIYKCEYKLC